MITRHDKKDIEVPSFEEDLALIVEVHNNIRSRLYPDQSMQAHLVNENTILRLQTLLETYGCGAMTDEMLPGASDGEIAARTLKYLRNRISHKDHGLFRVCLGSPQWPAFKAFATKHPDVLVPEGQPICLASDTVLQPLIAGLIQWAHECGKV
jgi:hypothetical protein